MKRLLVLVAVLVSLSLFVAGCGGSTVRRSEQTAEQKEQMQKQMQEQMKSAKAAGLPSGEVPKR